MSRSVLSVSQRLCGKRFSMPLVFSVMQISPQLLCHAAAIRRYIGDACSAYIALAQTKRACYFVPQSTFLISFAFTAYVCALNSWPYKMYTYTKPNCIFKPTILWKVIFISFKKYHTLHATHTHSPIII